MCLLPNLIKLPGSWASFPSLPWREGRNLAGPRSILLPHHYLRLCVQNRVLGISGHPVRQGGGFRMTHGRAVSTGDPRNAGRALLGRQKRVDPSERQRGREVGSTDSGTGLPRFASQLCCLPCHLGRVKEPLWASFPSSESGNFKNTIYHRASFCGPSGLVLEECPACS